MNNSPLKIIFVTGSLLYNSMVIQRVAQYWPTSVKAIILGNFIYPKKGLLSGARMVIKKAGWKYFFFKVFETFIFKIMVYTKGDKSKMLLFNRLSQLYKISLLHTRDLNGKKEVDFIRNLNPDLIISMIPQKIGDEIIKIPKMGVINLHPGLLPEYRGFGGYFWPLVENFGFYGYTIHFINEEIDAGDIILREAFPITSKCTVQNMYYSSMKYGSEGLFKVLEQFGENRVERKPQSVARYPCRPWPNAKAIRLLKENGYPLFRFKDLWEIYKNDF